MGYKEPWPFRFVSSGTPARATICWLRFCIERLRQTFLGDPSATAEPATGVAVEAPLDSS